MSQSNPPVVPLCQLLCQVRQDLFSKEAQTGYTYTYVWMANQVGHFTLGFLPTLLFTWFFVSIGWPLNGSCEWTKDLCGPVLGLSCWVYVLVLGEIAFWVFVEAWDVWAEWHNWHGPFPFDFWDVFWDALTALLFIGFGLAVAFVSLKSWCLALLAFAAGLVVALLLAWYWLPRRFCFQRAKLPYLFRLADFGISDGAGSTPGQTVAQIVEGLLRGGPGDPRHVLLFGRIGTGRTSLAVGIGTEYSFTVRRARYLTFAQFIEAAQDPPATNPSTDSTCNFQPWPWDNSDILILDDVVDVVNGQMVQTPGQICGLLAQLAASVPDKLACRRTVWVLGPADDAQAQVWARELANALDENSNQFRTVLLGPVPIDASWRHFSFLVHH